jgi:hypothetical protein
VRGATGNVNGTSKTSAIFMKTALWPARGRPIIFVEFGDLAQEKWHGCTVMGVPLLRPLVRDLVFQLYGRPLHPELFDILAVRKVQRGDYELTIRITRTGHVITWENPSVCLTEVTAAADQPLPQRRRLLNYRLRGEHCGLLPCAHGVTYQTSFQVESMAPEIFLHVHEEILVDGGKRGLLHNFKPNHRLALAPLSLVAVESRAGCLFLSTFHTFPDEYTVVKSQSLIEIKS